MSNKERAPSLLLPVAIGKLAAKGVVALHPSHAFHHFHFEAPQLALMTDLTSHVGSNVVVVLVLALLCFVVAWSPFNHTTETFI